MGRTGGRGDRRRGGAAITVFAIALVLAACGGASGSSSAVDQRSGRPLKNAPGGGGFTEGELSLDSMAGECLGFDDEDGCNAALRCVLHGQPVVLDQYEKATVIDAFDVDRRYRHGRPASRAEAALTSSCIRRHGG